jgi:hypothetical protein
LSSIRRFVRTEWRDRIAKAAITAIFRPGTGPQSRKSVLPIPLAYILIFPDIEPGKPKGARDEKANRTKNK